MIECNAELFKIAMKCASKEATRFYLQGVYVEPHHEKGVTLTATDGTRLVCIRDENGKADEKAIISLSPAALKECRGKVPRVLAIDGANAEIKEGVDVVAVSPKCRIDGVYPDYRRAVPAVEFGEKSRPGHFNGKLLESFCEIAADLQKEKGERYAQGLVRVLSCDPNNGALILFTNDSRAFGILMPVRADGEEKVPVWFKGS